MDIIGQGRRIIPMNFRLAEIRSSFSQPGRTISEVDLLQAGYNVLNYDKEFDILHMRLGEDIVDFVYAKNSLIKTVSNRTIWAVNNSREDLADVLRESVGSELVDIDFRFDRKDYPDQITIKYGDVLSPQLSEAVFKNGAFMMLYLGNNQSGTARIRRIDKQ